MEKKSSKKSIVRSSLLVATILCVGLSVWHIQKSQAQSFTNLTTCQTIQGSGNYRLANNVSSSSTCFSIRASNVVFDGNGKTISVSSGDAIEVADYGGGPYHHVEIYNVVSTHGVRNFGEDNHHITFRNSTTGGISNYGGDDVTVTENTINGGVLSNNTSWSCDAAGVCQAWNQALNFTLTNNTITGSGSRMIDFHNYGDQAHPCPASGRVVTGNTITNTITDTSDNPLTVYLTCSTNDVFSNNTLTATGQATGFLIRDGWSNGNVFSNNIIHVNQAVNGSRAALALVSGNEGAAAKGDPSNNTFTNNVFIGDNSRALWMQGNVSGNTFLNNIFHSNHTEGSTIRPNNNYNHNTFYNDASGAPGITFFTAGAANTTFTNNIVSGTGHSITNTSSYTNFAAHHNLYQKRGGAVSFQSATTLAAWKTLSGEQANSFEANPLLNNPAANDFSLQAGSPALATASDGTNIGGWQSGGACVESWTCGAWSTCSNNTQTRTCADLNSCGTTASRPPLTQSCDSTAPTVSVTAPANGATVFGTTSVTASAADAVGVIGVQFKLDGANLGSEDTSSPYSISWNTTGASNATHTLTAVARDAAGQSTTSAVVTVTVNNAPPSCTEDWSCTAWSVCANNSQSRTCTDANTCGTTNTRPPLTQNCTMVDTTAPAAVTSLQAR